MFGWVFFISEGVRVLDARAQDVEVLGPGEGLAQYAMTFHSWSKGEQNEFHEWARIQDEIDQNSVPEVLRLASDPWRTGGDID